MSWGFRVKKREEHPPQTRIAVKRWRNESRSDSTSLHELELGEGHPELVVEAFASQRCAHRVAIATGHGLRHEVSRRELLQLLDLRGTEGRLPDHTHVDGTELGAAEEHIVKAGHELTIHPPTSEVRAREQTLRPPVRGYALGAAVGHPLQAIPSEEQVDEAAEPELGLETAQRLRVMPERKRRPVVFQ